MKLSARAKKVIRLGLGLGALAATLGFSSKDAHAQWSASGVPGVPNIPPSVLNQWMQNATQAGQSAQKQAPIPMPTTPGSSCPPVEIAPGLSIPVCANGFPKPPPGVIIPEALLTMPAFLAPSVDLRTQGLDGPVKDQKQTGVCYAFALSSVLESSLRKQGRQDVLSPLHVVAADAWENLWSSSRASEAIGPESTWPYDPIKACKLEKGPDECEHAYGVRTGTWRTDPQLVNERERQRSFGVAVSGKASSVPKRDQVQGVTTALAQGRVILATINIDSRAWGFRGINSQGVLAEYEVGDRGGHAVTLVGYRPAAGNTRQFLIHNSWGRSWGTDGYAWITEQSLRKHLTDAWLVDAQPTSGGGAAPLPPQSRPQTQACTSGTGLDLGSGRCAPLCRSGLAPFGGHCPLG